MEHPKTSTWNGWHIIAINGKFVVKNLTTIRMEFEAVEKKELKKTAIDLTNTTHLDSSAITILVNFYKRVVERGGIIVLFGMNNDIAEIFSIVGIDKVIPMCTSIDDFKQKYDNNTRA